MVTGLGGHSPNFQTCTAPSPPLQTKKFSYESIGGVFVICVGFLIFKLTDKMLSTYGAYGCMLEMVIGNVLKKSFLSLPIFHISMGQNIICSGKFIYVLGRADLNLKGFMFLTSIGCDSVNILLLALHKVKNNTRPGKNIDLFWRQMVRVRALPEWCYRRAGRQT